MTALVTGLNPAVLQPAMQLYAPPLLTPRELMKWLFLSCSLWRANIGTAQLTVPASGSKRPEEVDLLGLWGGEAVQSQLRASCRKFNIYRRIARGVEEDYDRDAQQGRVKIKELGQAYQKAREANGCSVAEPQTCRSYKELHAILGSSPTCTVKSPMDTLRGGWSHWPTGMNSEDEEMEAEEDGDR